MSENNFNVDVLHLTEAERLAVAQQMATCLERAIIDHPMAQSWLNWRPIETAPKDGSEILLYREDSGVFLGRWIAPCEFLSEGEYDGAAGWDEPDWFFADFVQGGRVTDGTPTLWAQIPLPSGQ